MEDSLVALTAGLGESCCVDGERAFDRVEILVDRFLQVVALGEVGEGRCAL
ncbi:hypothetical protein [Rhodococcus opacus]|uniref:hypothetical protein n=1 Tax=Rhodococcus opacus TaxID=37919 RepID=UPI001F56700B|nr:hypothetical protein [Rhodococcus opacus]UNN05270.1 hypothetical protein MOO23_40280 [Rhodococcus opacus]